jgi:hypothetical protein
LINKKNGEKLVYKPRDLSADSVILGKYTGNEKTKQRTGPRVKSISMFEKINKKIIGDRDNIYGGKYDDVIKINKLDGVDDIICVTEGGETKIENFKKFVKRLVGGKYEISKTGDENNVIHINSNDSVKQINGVMAKKGEYKIKVKYELDTAPLATMKINKDAHIEEFISKKGTFTPDEAKKYFYKAGILDVATKIMAVIDLHADNIMPSKSGPMIIDPEVAFLIV